MKDLSRLVEAIGEEKPASFILKALGMEDTPLNRCRIRGAQRTVRRRLGINAAERLRKKREPEFKPRVWQGFIYSGGLPMGEMNKT